jgi:hypothetical protein
MAAVAEVEVVRETQLLAGDDLIAPLTYALDGAAAREIVGHQEMAGACGLAHFVEWSC